jgi:hypothetical protein
VSVSSALPAVCAYVVRNVRQTGLKATRLRGFGGKRTREADKLILFESNRLARLRHQINEISADRWAFPTRPDGGRKDSKVSRVVEMECASRSLSW